MQADWYLVEKQMNSMVRWNNVMMALLRLNKDSHSRSMGKQNHSFNLPKLSFCKLVKLPISAGSDASQLVSRETNEQHGEMK